MNPLKIASAFGLAAAVANCVPSLPPYVEPAAQAPHALVKVRLVHHATPGPMYTGSIQLNDRRIEFPIDPAAPATRALRVRPEASSWRFGAEFYHLVTRTESYSTTESYQCGSTTTSYGSTPQYCTRQVQRTRTVTDHVTDASCAAIMSHGPASAMTYVVQFDFTGTGQCSAKCFEQKPKDDGTLGLEPCVGSRSGLAQ